ncbi:MAG: glycoside hydrolase family 2 TIM barrel-domain containing protein [Candidatus Pseudobacter hemicellulosilyticus]|uniref:Beta-mannosidase n=1 Tax=Candidatus Pseudobacter hemicellulosilyticus TaxID=3121375 RepID=A0AAJ5WZ74_9BACT|nr:MAG: glycoside hydrolase family 2 TIM barrel-domain containing protein [Pseudobacter sp.]
MFRKLTICCLLLCCVAIYPLSAQVQTLSLHSGWQFREQDDARWYPARVPGEVHLDLLANKLIPDPFYRDNEKKLQWIEKENWEYQTRFDVPANLRSQAQVQLVFDGLDTYAAVYLNDQLILEADNSFRQWRVAVKSLLKPTGNKLFIRFWSAQNKVDSLAKAHLPYVIPDNPRAYVRKAQYHFGWDWGPKFTTCGIWKAVKLEAFQQLPAEKPYQPPVQVELVQKPDQYGESFAFHINGQPVYMKGANYIPSDAFVTRMTRDSYRQMLLMAKEANMNMLRVWGGGIYEDDYFYDLCDSLGIYVWQDFMFAGTMVPGDDAFFANVREEVKYQVKRLRHHKSIVIWCGNNEIEEAFYHWGWQQQYRLRPSDSTTLWNDYVRLFRDSIPAWLKEVDPYRPYVSSSPRFHWSRASSITEGDSHYWGTWWGGEDFEVFEKKTGRFISEYGMQAMPNYSSILAITQPQDRYLFSDVLENHQRAGKGFSKLEGYLKGYMIDSARINKLSVEDYVYLTQCVQYYGFKNMILIHRSFEPRNMGTLLWQLNDCWPVASWSITDYYNRAPKAGWYAVKAAYSDTDRPERDLVRPKDLKLSDPAISCVRKGNTLVLKASSFAKYVYVELPGYSGHFSDNYFDLQPGVEKQISFDPAKLKVPATGFRPKVRSLFDIQQAYR